MTVISTMDKDDNSERKPTFRISVTISNNSNQTSSNIKNLSNHCNDNFCDQVPSQFKIETSKFNYQIDNERENIGSKKLNLDHQKQKQLKNFKFIQPQNHKSALFVNLSDRNNTAKETLFVSPDLNQASAPSPPNTGDSTLCSSNFTPIYEASSLEDYTVIEALDIASDTSSGKEERTVDDTMSQGCNFMSSLMSASRRRASSVTPTAPTSSNTETSTARRASSSNNLSKPATSGQLAVGVSNETICAGVEDADRTHIEQLEVCIDDPYDPQASHTASEVDIDELMEEENPLRDEVEYWEERLAERERQMYDDDVPRTLVENIIKLRRKLRYRDVERYISHQKSVKSDEEGGELCYCHMCPNGEEGIALSPMHVHNRGSDLESQLQHVYLLHDNDRLTASKFGSHLEPGQENTAGILNAVPPPGSLQQEQYLMKASSGTDSTVYSQVPSFDQQRHHRHLLPPHDHRRPSSRNRERKDEVYVQLASPNNQKSLVSGSPQTGSEKSTSGSTKQYRSSPVRPNHFKTNFQQVDPSIFYQDSSSTASSSSPH